MKIRGKIVPVLLHILAWITLFILPQFLFQAASENNQFRIHWGLLPLLLILMAVFYLNYNLLIPVMMKSRFRKLYPLAASAFIIILYFLMQFGMMVARPAEPAIGEERSPRQEQIRRDRHRGPSPRLIVDYNYFILSVLVTGFAYVLRVSEQMRQSEKQKKELEKERLSSELAFLKNQISPHFFFNTLNNIYSLIGINKEDAQEALHNLSKMMRYLLYESEKGNTTLGDEISFLENYIELMKLRLSDRVTLNVSLPDKVSNLKVPPLLFIPFIENAFKHGVSANEHSFINISIDVYDDEIIFESSNSINLVKGDRPEADSGIGLENVIKRLKLLFSDDYILNISDKEKVYKVELRIKSIKDNR